MQLAHLLPYLDAEIKRLQQARDLLVLSSSFTSMSKAFTQEQAVRAKSSRVQTAAVKAAHTQAQKPAADALAVSMVDVNKPKVATVVVRARIKTRRTEMPGHDSHAGKRKRLILADTALRGPVPSGPVVVSAEEVRKSQASKTAQTTRAAEVKRAGADLVSSFNWRSRTSDGRSLDSLLQRLMNIGEDTGEGEAAQLSPLGQSESFKAVNVTAGSKLD